MWLEERHSWLGLPTTACPRAQAGGCQGAYGQGSITIITKESSPNQWKQQSQLPSDGATTTGAGCHPVFDQLRMLPVWADSLAQEQPFPADAWSDPNALPESPG